MNQNEKIILILGIIILIIFILNIYNFIKKNKSLIKIKKNKVEYNAIVIDKRHYNENNRNLFYVKFSFDNKEEEYLVSECIYNTLRVNQSGTLFLKFDYFEDFK